MLDRKFIRENPNKIKEICQSRQVKLEIEKILELEEKVRRIKQEKEALEARQNQANKKIASAGKAEKENMLEEMRGIAVERKGKTSQLGELEKELEKLLCQIPNVCLEGVPIGPDEKHNVVLREVGKRAKFSFKPKDYLEIGETLDIIDVKRASKVSGSRFGYLKGAAFLLEFALVKLAIDNLIKEGFVPVIPPVLIRPEMMKAMGYIDSEKDLAERYFLEKDSLFLVGTSEQSIGPMHADETFQEQDLPKRYVAFSTCFREEAGSYGKDTRGILRVHQFDKIEMFSFCSPKESAKEHQLLLKKEEKMMQLLKIPYRVVQLCSGDLARPSAATYDIEAWLPGQNQYRETHSSSNCTDFQARRLNIRYRDNRGSINFVYTLNGTVFAMGRMIIAIIENYQQKDGSVKIPKILQKYLGFKEIKPKK